MRQSKIEMIYLVLPCSNSFGWGLCGKYIVKELSKRAEVRYVNPEFGPTKTSSDDEYRFFCNLLANPEELEYLRLHNTKYPVLQTFAIDSFNMALMFGPVTAPCRVGYTFFEDMVSPATVKKAAFYFDRITVGSSWCAACLKENGYDGAVVVLQGIDPLIFNPSFARKERYLDRFVVFSGGKFELRKGQDVVVRAYKVLQDRHPDVMLVNAWYNKWPTCMGTMEVSPLIHYRLGDGDYVTEMNRTLAGNGLDLARVVTLPLCINETMPKVYRDTDIGLFPNRCEGGSNLVLMEYMACGKPVIAANSTGHMDIVNKDNAILIENTYPVTASRGNQPCAVWYEPDLEETIHHLEWAYQHRDELPSLGQRAGEHLANFTWERTGKEFHQLLCPT